MPSTDSCCSVNEVDLALRSDSLLWAGEIQSFPTVMTVPTVRTPYHSHQEAAVHGAVCCDLDTFAEQHPLIASLNH